jgi:hypothetical protein
MKKHAVVLTLTLLELLALALLAFFGLVMRPDLAATYGLGEGGELRAELIGTATRVALSPWFTPLVGAAGALLFVSAWLPRRGANVRNKLLGAALVVTVLGLGWAIWAAYTPAFERLAHPLVSMKTDPLT